MSKPEPSSWRGRVASPSLISAEELNSLSGDDRLKIFDVRGTWKTPARALIEDYQTLHIEGAAFLDWTEHFLEQGISPGLASVSDESGAKKAFAALGINEGDLVVLYDDYSHMFAGRIWWAMRRWGFADVRVLNGGWKHWNSCGFPTSTVAPEITEGSFTPSDTETFLVELDVFLDTREQACVIDGRGAESFAGRADDPRTGHIPTSANVPFSAMLDSETGLFLEPNDISKVLDESAPQWRNKPIITTCGAGYAATVILLALSQLDQPASLFDGSFGLWKQDPKRPVSQILPTS